ncbi:MAG: tRNA (5-methylaminomethyl-2-thiouridine)(34)-methyltransferase MnmD [Owenweeksia sp.]
MKRQVTITRDNSKTLFVPELDEHYHSVHGAIQESIHVFIRSGLHEFLSYKPVHILEIGLGTGLNAWLSLKEATERKLQIEYTALEKYPVLAEEAEELNYTDLMPKGPKEQFRTIHQCPWEEKITLETEAPASFSLLKRQIDIRLFEATEAYDLIYFDAFAPSAQPDLWTTCVFQRMYAALKPDGLLVTYCVKGDVRRAMKSAGFAVEKIPGPPGKREMARAWKKSTL